MSIITKSDSYKYSHPWQYPSNMKGMFVYGEARSNKVYDATLFVGMQEKIKTYLMKPFTKEDVEHAQNKAKLHGIPFDIDGWMYILEKHNGYLPVEIKAVKEGTLVPTGNALFTIESTDENVPWVPGFLETLMMKVWYPSNVATRSYYVKQMIQKFWNDTVDDENMFGLNFAFHNFGDRGSSSCESAAIGGMAHLTQFMGTDNFDSLNLVEDVYGDECVGYSIPATEHSTTTSWGCENELIMIMKHLEYNKDKDIIAAVCDSYDYLKTVKAICAQDGEFQKKINSDDYPIFVMRPDSGNPLEMIDATLDIMEKECVPYTINNKGYKTFNKTRIIWGDGIDMKVMQSLLKLLKKRGYSAENLSFGSGGWLMQHHDRDTQGWAVKCSSIVVDEGSPIATGDGEMVWEPYYVNRDVFKDPATAPNKKSKKGKLTLWKNKATGSYFTDKINVESDNAIVESLNVVYRNGQLFNQLTFDEVRNS